MRPAIEIKLSDNALAVLRRRYLQKDAAGRVIETPHDLFVRVARAIAEAERGYGADDAGVEQVAGQYYEMMARLDFLPNSPTLMNAGRPLGQLSACFVLPVGDSMEEIFEANKQAAIIHKSGGGTGFAFSRLRPKNSIVASTSGVASGPVSFMKVFNASTEAVKQGGTRRGANMGILRVDHPDILEFISCKDDTGEVTNFNISVAITDTFMQAVHDGTVYDLIDPRTGSCFVKDGIEQKLDARIVFDKLVQHAWQTGEPGLVFIDRMNRGNPTHPSETIEATNPCGEQPLPPYDSCNLGSINLGHFVASPLPADYSSSRSEEAIDWNRLRRTVHLAVRFLDNVIDQNKYPIPQIEFQTKKNRRIGLGVMGWADLLVLLRLPYNSQSARDLGKRIMSFIETEARTVSSELAASRGRFPNWDGSIYKQEEVVMRNATVTTIAPTGTISIIANCSSGIEPYYALAFERNVMDGTRLTEVVAPFLQAAREGGFYSREVIEKIASVRSIASLQELPEEVRAIFLTAADVSPEDHIAMQAIFQAHCDSSVSKTINFAESATPSEVRRAFELAWELGCKGVTIYRDNSRPFQVLSTKPQPAVSTPYAAEKPIVAERPAVLSGTTEKIKTGYGNLYVTVNTIEGRPFELFATIGKSGYTTMADTEAICRMISLALRSGISVEQVIRQLRGIGGSNQVFSSQGKVTSIPDAIAQVLHRRFIQPGDVPTGKPDIEACPDCGSAVQVTAGCLACISCGYSSC